ncbi:uncharacterized protein LOC110981107 isoform X2 [Acanthaster planci]|uniref:Uncharacterized protein LOC110981107 isoform X2 n=1 Tax=Acanthaster planci TaxID=133434 RepID=A0A8B7YMZ9_ACAPL|nr:uncharacterized protein LOC110981107 isoform X2 [Acanthaster planci]
MFPKRTAPEVPEKKETTVYVFGEKDAQVALSRASRTEVKRAAICACAVVVTTLILVAGTLGAIALWLSFHHTPHDGHHVAHYDGDRDEKPLSPGIEIDDGGLWPVGDIGQVDVTESITEVPGAATGAGDILIDGNDRGFGQSETTTATPKAEQTTGTTPSASPHPESSVWDSFSVPYSVLSEQDLGASSDYGTISFTWDSASDAGSGSGSDTDGEDYEEIPYRSSATSYYSSSFVGESYDPITNLGVYEGRDDWYWEDDASGSGSGDTETSGDGIVPAVVDPYSLGQETARPVPKTPQEFTVVRYPVPVSNYNTLCTSNTCAFGFFKREDRMEVIETDLRMKPLRLTVLRKNGGRIFTMTRDEDQGYRAILLDESGICLLTRLDNTENLHIRQNSAVPIVEKLRVTLPVELPVPLLSQISGPIMDTCRNVPVFWAQQVGDSDEANFITRMRRSSPPSAAGSTDGGVDLGGGIHFQCCWCAYADDPCPCECGRF